jgi:MFS family permease
MFSPFDVFRKLKIIPPLSREVSEQYMTVLLRNFGVGLIRLFEPVFVYQIVDREIKWVALYYFSMNLIRFFIIPISGKVAARFGFEHTMALSFPIQIIFYFLLNLTDKYHNIIYILPFLGAIYLSLYWTAYHTNFAHYGNNETRGKQYTGLNLFNDIIAIASPIIGGAILSFFGFNVLFFCAGLIILISSIPMLSTREKFKPVRFRYWKAVLRIIISYKTYKHNYFLTYFGLGGAGISSLVFWSIFISLILQENYSLMGLINGMLTFMVALYSIYIGSAYDKYSIERNKANYYTSLIFYSIIWPLRALVTNWWQILTVNTISSLNGRSLDIGIVSTMYRRASVHGNLKYVIFYEQSLVIGRLLFTGLIFAIVSFLGTDYQLIFFIAGIWSLLMGVMWKKK